LAITLIIEEAKVPAGFPGFPNEGLAFLRALEKNNRREWFQPRKHIYDEKLKAPMIDLVTRVVAAMMGFAPDYIAEPEKAIFRIYRDTRFSKDKTPYKTHIAAVFHRRGLGKGAGSGLYFAVSAKEVEVAGGIYQPDPATLLAVRSHLAENHEDFRRLIRDRSLRRLMGDMQGEQLTRVPKGFACDHAAADLVRYRQFLFYVLLDPAIAATPKLEQEVVKRFRVLTPFLDFLNAPLASAAKKSRPWPPNFPAS
jgi:uncharacterized protein (TIGR02453 family)